MYFFIVNNIFSKCNNCDKKLHWQNKCTHNLLKFFMKENEMKFIDDKKFDNSKNILHNQS